MVDTRYDQRECEPKQPRKTYVLDFRAGAKTGRKKTSSYGSDISALATVGDTLFCASDETGSVERLDFDEKTDSFRKRRSFSLTELFPRLLDPANAASKEEADVEGLAVDDGYLWITGSHSRKRPVPEKPRALADFAEVGWDRKRALLGRVPIAIGDRKRPSLTAERDGMAGRAAMMAIGDNPDDDALRSMLRDDPLLGQYIGLPSKENGFDVEGLAVSDGKVVIGLRGPVLGSHAFAIVLKLEENGDGVLVPKMIDGKPYRLHALHLFGLGIRDLLFDGGRLYILAGPTQKVESLQRVFAIDDFFSQPPVVPMRKIRILLTLPIAGYGDHAEGIAFFRDKSKVRLLVAYDSPSEKRWDEDKDRLIVDAFNLPD